MNFEKWEKFEPNLPLCPGPLCDYDPGNWKVPAVQILYGSSGEEKFL